MDLHNKMCSGKKYFPTDDGSGAAYHKTLTAWLLVVLLIKWTSFDLKVEFKDAHPFDDIVLTYGIDNILKCIQCKHRKNSSPQKKKFNNDCTELFLKYDEGWKSQVNSPSSLVLCTNKKLPNQEDFEEIRDPLTEGSKRVTAYRFKEEFIKTKDSKKKDFLKELELFVTDNIKIIKAEIKRKLSEIYNEREANEMYLKLLSVKDNILEELDDSGLVSSFTHNDLYNLVREVNQKSNDKVWFNLKDPVKDFVGMEGFLNEMEGNGNLIILIGPEGTGKTELALQFAKKFFHAVFIKEKEDCKTKKPVTHIESIRKFAFGQLGIHPNDFNGNEKELHVLVKEVSEWFPIDKEEERTIFILDDCSPDIVEIAEILAEHHKVIITSRKGNWNQDHRIAINGFTCEEAKRYIREHCHESNSRTIEDFSATCNQNPGKIRELWSEFESIRTVMSIKTGNYSLEKYLQYKIVTPYQ